MPLKESPQISPKISVPKAPVVLLDNRNEQYIGGRKLSYVHYPQFNPPISTKFEEIPDFMKPFFKLQKGLEPLNLENIDIGTMDKIVSKMLNKKGTDIKSMTPVDAIRIAGEITSAKIQYNRKAEVPILEGKTIQSLESSTTKDNPELQALYQQRAADAVPVDRILENGIVGVCRNYTRVFTAIIDSLKRIQLGAGGYALRNMYSIPAGTYNHDLCMIIYIGDKDIQTMVVDPTNMDYNSELGNERKTPDAQFLAVDPKTAREVVMDFFRLLQESYLESQNESKKKGVSWIITEALRRLHDTLTGGGIPSISRLLLDAGAQGDLSITASVDKTPPSKSEKG